MGTGSSVEPLQYLPAPMAFLAGVIALAIVLAREVRKLMAERNADQSSVIEQMRADVDELTKQVDELRESGLKAQRDAYEAKLAAEREHQEHRLADAREIHRLRQKLIRHGHEPDGPDDGLPGHEGSETP